MREREKGGGEERLSPDKETAGGIVINSAEGEREDDGMGQRQTDTLSEREVEIAISFGI